MKNRVAKLVSIGKIKIVEEEIRSLSEGEVLVRLRSVGICGSDIHYFLEGGLGSFKQPLPMYVGHEPAGVVEKVYSANGKWKKGDRVAIEPGKACFRCEWCLKGRHNLCTNSSFLAANGPGAFADYIIVHSDQLVKLPRTMSFPMGALLEPLGVALHAVHIVNPFPNAPIVIVGSGSIGLCLLSVLQRLGFHEIYLIDKLPYRVKFAKKMGATKSFLFKDAIVEIKKITHRKGVPYVFDTGGTEDSINACIDIVATSGSIGLIGIPTADYVRYNPHKLRTKEVCLYNVRRSNQTLEDCVKLFAKAKSTERMITHKFALDDIQKAFRMVSEYKNNVIKCMIVNE